MKDKVTEYTEKLKTDIGDTVSTMLSEDERIIKMKELIPAFDTIFVLLDWSGWCDGDEEFDIFRPAYDDDCSYSYLEVCQTSENSEHEWKSEPSELELEQISQLNGENYRFFITSYNDICHELSDLCYMMGDVGSTITFKVDVK